MEFVIVTRDLLEIYVMTFALKGHLEFLQIVTVTVLFNLKTLSIDSAFFEEHSATIGT